MMSSTDKAHFVLTSRPRFWPKTWSCPENVYPRVVLAKLDWTSYRGHDITTSFNFYDQLHW